MRGWIGVLGCVLGGLLACGGTAASPDVAATREEPVVAGPAEVGHLPVPAMAAGALHAARLFYSFRPADDGDGRRPLFVFMNGGPGFATSAGLLSWGIGPSTLTEGAEAPVDNPARWTRFGNLLFLDERHAGFSYGLRPGSASSGCGVLDDAAEHLLAVLRFLDAHPQFERTPIVLVGESYGGMRVVSMLKLLRDPSLAPIGELSEAIAARGAQLNAQFARAVLIQPLVFGDLQYAAQKELLEGDPLLGKVPEGYDGHDVRKTIEQQTALDDLVLRAYASPSSRERLLGVRVEDAPTMKPAARLDGFRSVQTWKLPSEELPDRELSARLGLLRGGDRYFALMARSCVSFNGPENVKPWFLELLRTTRFFLTNARYDAAIHTPAIVAVMRKSGIEVETPASGIVVHLPASESLPASTATVRYRPYDSGHAVAMSAAEPFAADVGAWLNEP